jgi:hypothetical protein
VQSATTSGTNFTRSTSGGTDLNASSGILAGGSIELRRGERWNGGYLEFRFDMTGYQTAGISFAYRTTTSLPTTATVEWSTDGGASYAEYAVLNSSDYSSNTRIELDFEGITGFADARVRLRYSTDGGSAGSGLGAFFDNIRIEVWEAPANAFGTYAAWRLDRFGSLTDPLGAPAADALQRGIPNAIEYALGLDALPDPRLGLPVASGEFQFEFTRRTVADARILVETSSTLALGSWTVVATLEPGANSWTGSALLEETAAGDFYYVQMTHPDGPPAAGDPRFLRVRVEIED